MVTIGEVERGAREIVLDTYEDAYRFSYNEVFTEVGNALKRLRSVRPDSKYVDMKLSSYSFPDLNAEITTKEEADTIRSLPIYVEDRWLEALIYYVAHKLYMQDDSDTVNAQQSENCYARFERIALS